MGSKKSKPLIMGDLPLNRKLDNIEAGRIGNGIGNQIGDVLMGGVLTGDVSEKWKSGGLVGHMLRDRQVQREFNASVAEEAIKQQAQNQMTEEIKQSIIKQLQEEQYGMKHIPFDRAANVNGFFQKPPEIRKNL